MTDQQFLDEVRTHLRRAEKDPSAMRRSMLGIAAAVRKYQESVEPNELTDQETPAPLHRTFVRVA